MIGIYCITNIHNNKKYIGCSNDITRRWKDHKTTLKKGVHDNKHLQRAYNKYGDVFNYTVLEECSSEELKDRERYYISLYDTNNIGYNQTSGGDGLINPSIELKQRLHDSAIKREIWKQFPDVSGKNNPNYDKHVSEETRAKMSQKAKERERKPHSEETKQLISRRARERDFVSHFPKTGRVCLEETKKKIGEANSIKVQASTGEIFNSMVEAAKWANCARSNIGSVCHSGRSKHAGHHPVTNELLSWKIIN